MKRKLFFILSLFLIYSTYIFGENFPQKAKTINDFIPKGWKKILTANGDLNKDKLEDTVIVIEKEDKENIKKRVKRFRSKTKKISFQCLISEKLKSKLLKIKKEKNLTYEQLLEYLVRFS